MVRETKPGLLSIVVTNHNYARFIGDAFESIARQEYGPTELIVVDDASTDNSLEVIEQGLADIPGLIWTELVVNPQRLGKLGSLNRVMDHVRGEYMIVLDADDYLSEVYARRCVVELAYAHARDEKLAIVYTDCNLIDARGRWIGTGRANGFDAGFLDYRSYIPAPAAVLTEAMRSAMPFNETIREAAQHHIWQRVVKAGWTGLHLPEPIFYYRMHGGNVSGLIEDRVEGRREEFNLAAFARARQRPLTPLACPVIARAGIEPAAKSAAEA